MSLKSRTTYLAALADKASQKIGPLLDEFHKLKEVKTEITNAIRIQLEEVEEKLNIARLINNTDLISSLEELKNSLNLNINELLTDFITLSSESLADSMEAGIKDIDGLSISISMDVDNDILIPTITPELINITTDFVKNTLTSEETKVVVSTAVTGNAGPYTVIGTGTQAAPIVTT